MYIYMYIYMYMLLLLSCFSRVQLVWPHGREPTRIPRPWDPPGKNTCHFLLQCMKVKSESEAVQSCPTPSNPMDYSLPASFIHWIFQARVLEWVAIAFPECGVKCGKCFKMFAVIMPNFVHFVCTLAHVLWLDSLFYLLRLSPRRLGRLPSCFSPAQAGPMFHCSEFWSSQIPAHSLLPQLSSWGKHLLEWL